MPPRLAHGLPSTKPSTSKKRAPSVSSVSDSEPEPEPVPAPRKRRKAQSPELIQNVRHSTRIQIRELSTNQGEGSSDERTAVARNSSPVGLVDIEQLGQPRALSPPQGILLVHFHASFRSYSTEPIYHRAREHEFPESGDFQVIGETDPVEYSDSEDEEGVPVRVLTDFTIYDAKTRQLVPIAELLTLNHGATRTYTASGCVKAWIDEDEWEDDEFDQDEDEEDEDDSRSSSQLREDRVQRVKLTRIKKFTLHDMKKRGRQLDR